ncbi:recombinase family protein [Candidatus Poribacteria bacterium]
MKKCGFVIRVSTDRQARNKEGSLTNQLQRLCAHVDYRNLAGEEEWREVERYVLKAVSGKDSLRSKEFARLFEDIKAGRINTVICTALDRISRSVRDFLSFFEILNEYNVEFVCLKQNYDTTSAQGKLFITIMMALAEFEREQTSERNKAATLARAERGLWNGGQIIGYDLDPDKKGHLVLNEEESILVNFAYDTYLECGSIFETAKVLNGHGYRTKEYTSRRDKFHPAKKFSYTSVLWMLTNYAYIGKKEVNKKKKSLDQEKCPENERYSIVDAVWDPIVDEEKFHGVQNLLRKNLASKHNGTKPAIHTYILNGGLLWCAKCGGEMEGRSGTGAKGTRYYYYVCKNKSCKFRVPADEIERVVLERIKGLSMQEDIMADIIKSTNEKLQKELPRLEERKALLQKELMEIRDFADGIIDKWASMAGEDSTIFLKDKLDQLGKRRREIESGLEALEEMTAEMERESVSQELVMLALNKFTDVFQQIQPYRQKELLRLVLHKAILAPDSMKIALYGRSPDIGLFSTSESDRFAQTSTWLPRQDSNLRQGG